MATLGEMFANENVKKVETHPQRVTKWIHYTKLCDHPEQYCNEKNKEEIIQLARLIEACSQVLDNVLCRKINDDQYEIISGHKRRRACKYLVEEEGKEEYGFIPCYVEIISDVQAEFQMYVSNSYHEESDYEKMHKLGRMKSLLEKHPEEFPKLQTGRMVERLARELHISKTTTGEFLKMSKNLGENAKTAFKGGVINKSAAFEMAALPEEEQNKLLDAGVTAQKDIKIYKEEKLEPAEEEIKLFYEMYIKKHDKNRDELKEYLIRTYGRCHSCGTGGAIDFSCTPKGVKLNKSMEITWAKFVKKINEYYPVEKNKVVIPATEPKVGEKVVPESGTDASVASPTEDDNIAGQLCVVDVDMNVEEDIAIENKLKKDAYRMYTATTPIHSSEPDNSEYTLMYFLHEQERKLVEMEKATTAIPIQNMSESTLKALKRQRTIVEALLTLAEIKETSTIKERTAKLVQPKLPIFCSTKERREWLFAFKDWGVWYTDEKIGCTYYRYIFQNETTLIAEVYEKEDEEDVYFHLVGGPKERETNVFGMPQYPYHESYSRQDDSVAELLEFLKAIQK